MTSTRHPYTLPPINLLKVLIEIGLIIFFVLIFTPAYQNTSPQVRVRGNEFSFLIGSGVVASNVLKQTGRIPLWNPLMAEGEPLLENPFSFVLNPLMTGPIMLFGNVQGPKVAVLLHILLMGIGGWALGRMLRLESPGRVFLGMLLAGSGSVAAAIGAGFYQMSLSQTYLPWVLVGLIGTLYSNRRWPIGLLAVSSYLLLTAGVFWYVLPTAIAVAVFTLFLVIHWNSASRHPEIDSRVVGRLLIATILTLGLSAVRMLPQLNFGYSTHVTEDLSVTRDFMTSLSLYFTQHIPDPAFSTLEDYYHYILPLPFALALLILRIIILAVRRKQKPLLTDEWRLVATAAILIFIFTVWAEGGTPVLVWLYRTVPFLTNWRVLGRMGAAASPWVAIVGAVWFDEIIGFFLQLARSTPSFPAWMRIRFTQPLAIVFWLGAFVLAAVGLFVSWDVLNNWNEVAGIESAAYLETDPLIYLRLQHPGEMLPVFTTSFWIYVPFYETLSRASSGDPDFRVLGAPSTIGTNDLLRTVPEYAVGNAEDFRGYVTSLGYSPIPGAPRVSSVDSLWENPKVPTYAFLAPRSTLESPPHFPLTRQDTTPVSTYEHHFDSIDVTVGGYTANSVLVVGEADYPGWNVTLNGSPAQLESVAGRLAVVLPDNTSSVNIVFTYRPVLLYTGGWITIFSVLIFTLFILRLDERIPLRYRLRAAVAVGNATTTVARKAVYVLTSPEALDAKREGKKSQPDPILQLPAPVSIGLPEDNANGESANGSGGQANGTHDYSEAEPINTDTPGA